MLCAWHWNDRWNAAGDQCIDRWEWDLSGGGGCCWWMVEKGLSVEQKAKINLPSCDFLKMIFFIFCWKAAEKDFSLVNSFRSLPFFERSQTLIWVHSEGCGLHIGLLPSSVYRTFNDEPKLSKPPEQRRWNNFSSCEINLVENSFIACTASMDEREREEKRGRAMCLCLKMPFYLLCWASRHKNRFLYFRSAIYSKTVKEKYFVLHLPPFCRLPLSPEPLSVFWRTARKPALAYFPSRQNLFTDILRESVNFSGGRMGTGTDLLFLFGINFNLHAWMLEIPVLRNRNN